MAEAVMGPTEMMPVERPRIDLMSRISVRGIGAGVLVLLASQLVLMALGGAFKVWGFPSTATMGRVQEQSTAYWAWSFLCWIASAFVGGYVAAVAARASTQRDGLLHGAVTWAAVLALDFVPIFFYPNMFVGVGAGFLWGYLLSNLAALATALVGGHLGARSEQTALLPTGQLPERPTERRFGTTQPQPS